jgi:UDP-N-acetylglucosamine 2-epimerase (non-hydrolysing)/GDP/UDP-N,N'-diacetylbacillosamine 2-epimerase (hydrolysing)
MFTAAAPRWASPGGSTWSAPRPDRIRPAELLSRDALARQIGVRAGQRWIVVTFHPVTSSTKTPPSTYELLAALEKTEGTLIITYPNADTAGRLVIERLDEFAARHPRCRLVRSLGDRAYLSLLRHADLMVGNSSSGLIEAPSFELPVVNVGVVSAAGSGARTCRTLARPEEIHAIESALAPGARMGFAV